MKHFLAVALALGVAVYAQAAELRVLTSGAVKSAMADLKPQFESATGHKLALSSDTSGAIFKRIAAGESADMIILTSSGIDDLIKQGKVVPGSKAEVAKSGIGAVVRAGAPKPDISTPDKFKQALLAANTVSYTAPASGGASGTYFAKMLVQLGIADEVNKKTRFGDGGPIALIVAKGEAELGMQQIPELLAYGGVDYVGPLPGSLQFFTLFAAGIPTAGKEPEAATAFIKFLATPAALAVMKSKGLD